MPTETDALILKIIEGDRLATEEEMAAIARHVARASFPERLLPLRASFRAQLEAAGHPITARRLPSVEWHLLKRVVVEQQWPVGTTAGQYVADLRQAVQSPEAQIWTYRYATESTLAVMAPSHVTGPQNLPWLFVIYRPRFGAIVSGFQASGPEAVFTDEFERLRKHR